MPKPMAEALGWPEKALGWGDVLALTNDPQGWGGDRPPRVGAVPARQDQPATSPPPGSTPPSARTSPPPAVSSDLTARERRRPEGGRVRQGRRAGRRALRRHDADLPLQPRRPPTTRGQGLTYISAVTVEEKSVWDYNQGNPTGDPATLGKHAQAAGAAGRDLPEGGHAAVSDNPYVVLNADWVDRGEEGGGRRLPRLPPGAGAAEARSPTRRSATSRARPGAARSARPTACCPTSRSCRCSTRPRRPCSTWCRSPGTRCASGPGCCWSSTCPARWASAVASGGKTKLELAKEAAIQARWRSSRPTTRSACGPSPPSVQGGVDPVPSWCRSAGEGTTCATLRAAHRRPGAGRRHRALRDHRAARRWQQVRKSFDPQPDQRGRVAHRRQERVPARQQPRRRCSRDLDAEHDRRARCGCSPSRTATRPTSATLQEIAEASRGGGVRRHRPGHHRPGPRRRAVQLLSRLWAVVRRGS